MKYMTSNEIRTTWLKYFEENGHRIIESAPLIPFDDPTLLWINAGVAPLKKYFDGTLIPPSKRLVNIQKCLRTNDIDNVGKTARHHTFFEMLGNFSIGDYFKEEALKMALEILTDKKYFNFAVENLYITYYPTDLTTKQYWLNLGIKETRLIPTKHNYWEIGEGPSGPNTEIFYDRGEEYDNRGTELIVQDIENDRFVEIWNIVFSQYNAKKGKKRSEYEELPAKNIDTGAGLERFASILQNTKTNFETDLFMPIIKKLEEVTQIKYIGQESFKIIVDHIKTLVMTISDGAVLSNEGRGYVLRRILRRALKHGNQLKIEGPFLTKLTNKVVEIMEGSYPEVKKNLEITNKIILSEEKQFLKTLSKGEALINKIVKEKNKITKEDSFLLFDTYGFPLELQEEYAYEHNVLIDKKGFYELLKEQQKRSRESRKETSSMAFQEESYLKFKEKSTFVGYKHKEVKTKVIKVFDKGVVLKETPFYATQGGQIADSGTINGYEVLDVVLLPNGQHLHIIEGTLKNNEVVVAKIDKLKRFKIKQNHTATHLLHKALKKVLGDHVNQQGSLVSNELLRFDFNHYESLTEKQILEIEKIVKETINKEIEVKTKSTTYKEAVNHGATALFGEKYGDVVRVVSVGDFSSELCGGTHVSNTKEIKDFQISSIFSIGSGIYRIEAFSGKDIISDFKKRSKNIFKEINILLKKEEELLKEIKEKELNLKHTTLKTPKLTGSYQDTINLRDFIKKAKESNHELTKAINKEVEKELLSQKDELIDKRRNNLIITEDFENNVLRGLLFELYDKIKSDILLLLNIKDGKMTYMIKTNKNNARDIIKKINEASNGSGGGRNDFATGGSSDIEQLEEVIKLMETF